MTNSQIEEKIKELFFDLKGENAICWNWVKTKIIDNEVVCKFQRQHSKFPWEIQTVKAKLHNNILFPYFGEF